MAKTEWKTREQVKGIKEEKDPDEIFPVEGKLNNAQPQIKIPSDPVDISKKQVFRTYKLTIAIPIKQL